MTMNHTVLVVDDDVQIRRFLKVGLATSNMKAVEARSANSALALFSTQQFDAIILDIGLPDRDGFEVLSQIRKHTVIPVIMLSVRNDEFGKVRAFNLGADDYVTKPFGMPELLARIKTAFRHSLQSKGTSAIFKLGNLEVDLVNYHVRRSGVDISLTKTELALFRILLEHSGKVLTHEFLLRNIRGRYQQADAQYLRVYIRALRNKIELGDEGNKFIHTISGIGYRLVVPNICPEPLSSSSGK